MSVIEHPAVDDDLSVAAVMPVRNRAKFIGRALDSILAQTHLVAEIIVVDDASTDATPDIVEALARADARVKVVRLETNVGAAAARNIGVQAANSTLIGFLDSDDIWYSTKLEKQLLEFKGHPDVVAAFTGSHVIYSDRTFSHMPKPETTLTDLYASNCLSTTSSALVTKAAFEAVGGFDPALPSCQDWDLFLRLAERGRIRTVQEDLIEFLNHDEERISRNKTAVLAGHEIVRNRIYERVTDQRLLRRIRSSHNCTLADMFSSLMFEPGRAVGHALTALALSPSRQSFRMCGRVAKRLARSAF